jgi:hypothetical protein
MTGGTTIDYSPLTLAVTLSASAITALGTLAAGLVTSQATTTAAGAVLTVATIVVTYAARGRFRANAPALARHGELLIGGALRTPLNAADTTYELVSTHDAAWVIVLHHPDGVRRISPGGLKVAGSRRFTRAVANDALQRLGLEPYRPR